MYLIEHIQQISRDMWKRKLRSLLALFGIVWGAVAVVLLLALGNGFAIATQNSMGGYVLLSHNILQSRRLYLYFNHIILS